MTTAQLQLIADQVASVPVDDIAELTDLIFDTLEARHTPDEVKDISYILLEQGVELSAICKRKHPPAPK